MFGVEKPEGIILPGSRPIYCAGLSRVVRSGGGQGNFILYQNIVPLDGGPVRRVEMDQVIAPLSAVPEAIDILFKALVEAGMNNAAAAARRCLGQLIH